MENTNANIAHTTDILAARMIEGADLLKEYAKKIDEARASTEGKGLVLSMIIARPLQFLGAS